MIKTLSTNFRLMINNKSETRNFSMNALSKNKIIELFQVEGSPPQKKPKMMFEAF